MEEDGDSITVQEGLSAQTLEALFGFLNTQHYGDDSDGVVNTDDLISPDHICTAYTETDMNVIMQTIGRLQQAKKDLRVQSQEATSNRVLGESLTSCTSSYTSIFVTILQSY